MSEFNNVYLNQLSFDELRQSLSLPDVDAMARRDSEMRLFDENVSVSRNGAEVILEVNDEYLKSLSLNTSLVIHDEKSAEELLRVMDWLVEIEPDSSAVDRKCYHNGRVQTNYNTVSHYSSELFAA